jgi:hypothetical protein
MLRCKTNSANDAAAGGPVSSTTPALRCTPGKISDCSLQNSIRPTARQFFAICVIASTRVAANVLQHGRSVECEGFGGCFCACMGQPSGFSEESGRGAAVSTQWFDRPNHAQIATDAAHARRTERRKTKLTRGSSRAESARAQIVYVNLRANLLM